MNDGFCEWWRKTEFGSRMKRTIFENKRQADCWRHFHQVAGIQDGTPKVMCKQCCHVLHHPADGHRGTSSMRKHIQGPSCRRESSQGNDIRTLLQEKAHSAPQKATFTHQAWIEGVISFITALRLPFQLVEHPQFHALIKIARLAPSFPEIPSAYTVRRQLREMVQERQQSLLLRLPKGAKLSIALDC
ncbi:uncharacterized protein N7496_002076 [Penicillium cataractarum]|uniref:BED-type domain-containing protein n=1 Tax=Penicillium cataractarum TaxID=2100454 RepID=A0A9W9SNK2_9EURO|nr:uncharacterized protein N7496_002076 [Penicillium cataractarum]KAJ5379648.1 hypothetical protein N7496_002076 [Penicillium cataractarum]